MSRVKCAECGRVYTYETDDFCPQCGAYNQPGRNTQSYRVDGVDKSNHTGSFSHREIHREKSVRQVTGLDQEDTSKWTDRKKKQVKAPIVPLVIWIIVLYQMMMLILSLIR